MANPEVMAERRCLTPTKEASHKINQLILDRLHTATQTYPRTDRVITDDPEEAAAYPIEFLNSQTPTGMPLHELEFKVATPLYSNDDVIQFSYTITYTCTIINKYILFFTHIKVGATIILLRNINPRKGLCNGTCLIVRNLQHHLIWAEVIASEHRGHHDMIPRITMSSKDTALPIDIARTQFPVRLAYCLTINKAQGQSLRKVGVYLPEPVFTHGQLYVAISRAKSFAGIMVMLPQENRTKNIVYPEVLQ